MSMIERQNNLSAAKRALLERLLQNKADVTHKAPPEPARTPTERILCEIWSSVLTVETISIHDRYMALGGDSIRALQISARARKLGLNFAATHCFEHDTIAKLAAFVDLGLATAAPSDGLGSTLASPQNGPDKVSFGEERLWIQHQTLGKPALYNTFTGLRISGPFNPTLFEQTVDNLVQRHELLRARYVWNDDRLIRHIDDAAAAFKLPVVALQQAGKSLDEIIKTETTRPFNLEKAPLFRCLLVEEVPDRFLLILTAHHIICDAWSMRLLLEELIRIYEGLEAGFPSPLDPVPGRYNDFAAWQRDQFASGALTAQSMWWQNHLAGAPVLHGVPTSYPRPNTRSHAIDIVYFDLPDGCAASVEHAAQAIGCTPYVILLSAWHILLQSLSKGSQIVIGTPEAGRRTQEMQQVVGFFLNTLAMHLEAGPADDLRTVLTANAGLIRQALAHADTPYDSVITQMNLPRSSAYSALVQIWFVLQEPRAEALRCGNLRLESEDLPRSYGPFELALSIERTKHGYRGWLEFATDLYTRDAAAFLAESYGALVQALHKGLGSNALTLAKDCMQACGKNPLMSRATTDASQA